MPLQFDLSMRFLDPLFHGRRDGGEPEWPPSPLRVFQALVAAAAGQQRLESLKSALEWLEQQRVPTMVAPVGVRASTGYCLSVPNNAMDVVARAWCRGNYSNVGDANPATHRTMKTVRPTLLRDGDAVHYLWSLPDPLTDEVRGHLATLSDIARSVIALGWGADMVVGHGAIMSDEQLDSLSGERWLPLGGTTTDGLRVPKEGTLEALIHRHARFLDRLSPDGWTFTAPPPLTMYDSVEYRRATDPPSRPVAAFSLLKLDASGFRPFDVVRRALTVAGMMRHVARRTAARVGWPDERINSFVLGHGESKDDTRHVAVGPKRFAYLPLPSLEGRGWGTTRVVGSIRRGILAAFAGDCEPEIAWARRALAGQELIDENTNQPVALLSPISADDRTIRCYTEAAASWATVTPVVLPGYDDPRHYRRRLSRGVSAEEQRGLLDQLHARVDGLLRKAITQAGFSRVLSSQAELQWRKVGFWSGTDLADRYGVPGHLRQFARYHVMLTWRDARNAPVRVPGPICLGAGRFHGVGLFAALGS
ncbi:MAG: type I-U CRISPR-associated protein Csb2 [Candidatus Eisenbacteria bacterium]|nr:type I-U CRISPR-associated protein Csb2 [Candidatus Eisenbacteria bacterium]